MIFLSQQFIFSKKVRYMVNLLAWRISRSKMWWLIALLIFNYKLYRLPIICLIMHLCGNFLLVTKKHSTRTLHLHLTYNTYLTLGSEDLRQTVIILIKSVLLITESFPLTNWLGTNLIKWWVRWIFSTLIRTKHNNRWCAGW